MSFNNLLKNISQIGIRSRISNVSVKEDERVISSFPEPKDDIERSYRQYQCQMMYYRTWFFFISNLAAGIILPFWISYMKRRKVNVEIETTDAVFYGQGKSPKLIPKELFEKYKNFQISPQVEPVIMDRDIIYIRELLKRYPCSWLFALKIAIKISECRGVIVIYNPKAIIVCNEFSYTSSAVACYMEGEKVEYINVMHGEKFYDIRDSFFRFSKCYIWDKHYEELFYKLRAATGQFYVSVPEALTISVPEECKKSIDFTYYLGDESGKQLFAVLQNLKLLFDKGYKVAVRPHPTYSKLEEVEHTFSGFEIEKKEIIGIEESVGRTKNVISKFSTVLYQAYNSGVNVVIDDISDTEIFAGLNDRDYIMLYKKHTLLSELIG